MACSCSSTSFISFTGAFVSSRGSSSCSFSSSSSSSPALLSFHHLQHQLPSLSSTRWDCEKSSEQTSCVAVIARQGQYDKSKKNTSQKGAGGGRYAGVAVKEDKVGRKGGNDGGRNTKPYNNNNNNSNPRSYNSSSDPRPQNNSSSNRRGNRLAVVDEEEDDEEDYEEEGSIRNFRSNVKPDNSSRNSMSSSNRRGKSSLSVVADEEEEDEDEEEFESDEEDDLANGDDVPTELLVMPIPPAGFVLDEDGSVSLMAPPHKRITTMVDSETKRPLDCLIRRVFSSSDGRQCFLLCPLDTPLQILRIEDGDVLKELQISDQELEDIFPTASYELAKRRLHLVQSGFCLTLRGGFCFSEEDVMDLNTVYGESSSTSLNEGVEIANFVVNESEYLVFTPLDPLMFVAYKQEKTGELLIAEDDLLEDEAVLDAIDEEKEFQAYMEEEEVVVDASSDEEEE